MKKRIIIGSAILQALLSNAAMSQSISQDETKKTAFTNASTTFDGIDFNLVRLVMEPGQKQTYRVVAKIENKTDEDKWALMILRDPYLVDELGNTYGLVNFTGIEACKVNGKWSYRQEQCYHNTEKAMKLAPGVPSILSLVFGPSKIETNAYNGKLAELATYADFRLRLAISQGRFARANRNEIKAWPLLVSGIPLPKGEQ